MIDYRRKIFMLLYHQIGRDYRPEVVSNPLCSSSQPTMLNIDEFKSKRIVNHIGVLCETMVQSHDKGHMCSDSHLFHNILYFHNTKLQVVDDNTYRRPTLSLLKPTFRTYH
ncbi:unnamed protein product [Arabidopsis thaliana]|uniref:Uncharacterized protein n=1 Tax=Arabidopsis thaliana TaxID=3702 RepID=A0A5S9X2B1_ARATH|nr:unnamed protein product [Arabidopsis thaliana]